MLIYYLNQLDNTHNFIYRFDHHIQYIMVLMHEYIFLFSLLFNNVIGHKRITIASLYFEFVIAVHDKYNAAEQYLKSGFIMNHIPCTIHHIFIYKFLDQIHPHKSNLH